MILLPAEETILVAKTGQGASSAKNRVLYRVWIGGLILGREAIRRWHSALDPRRWRRGRG